jgi:hypothetical protein
VAKIGDYDHLCLLKKLPLPGCNHCLQSSIFTCKFEPFKQLFMKKMSTLIIMLAAFFFAGAQGNSTAEDVLKLKETEYDFGKIPQGKPVYHNFEIINTSSQPLKLDNVQASCGCTTPEWSHDAIAPGATGTIKVGFNAATEGPFEKPITITYNTNQTKQMKIKGSVWKAPEGSAPANASVQFLKKQTL